VVPEGKRAVMEAMSWVRSGWARSLAVAAVLICGGAGCAAEEEPGAGADGGAAEAKCAYVVEYQGRSYLDVRGRLSAEVTGEDFTVGEKLGTGLLPGCDDSGGAGGTEEPGKVSVYQVQGVDPQLAVAAGRIPEEAVLVAVEGARLPSPTATS
jgi:hypothetical protein